MINRSPFRKLTALTIEQHPAFDAALMAAQNAGSLADSAILPVWSACDKRERLIVSTDSFGCMFIELFRYDARRFMSAHGRINVGVTRFYAGSGKMIMISKYARRATAAWRDLFCTGLGL